MVKIDNQHGDGSSPEDFDVPLYLIDTYNRVERIRRCSRYSRCNERFCDECGRGKAQRLRSRVVARQPREARYFLTLTRRRSGKPLGWQVRELKKCFRRLRNRHIWTENVIGGVYGIHLVGKEDPSSWHPHLHIVASVLSSKFTSLPFKSAWKQITVDSDGVHVTPVRPDAKEDWRLLNYVIKPPAEMLADDDEMLAEGMFETKGQLLWDLLGAWRQTFVEAEDEWGGGTDAPESIPSAHEFFDGRVL